MLTNLQIIDLKRELERTEATISEMVKLHSDVSYQLDANAKYLEALRAEIAVRSTVNTLPEPRPVNFSMIEYVDAETKQTEIAN